jgi:hypothetical protein
MGPRFIRSHPKKRHLRPTVGFEPGMQGSPDPCASALTTTPRGWLCVSEYIVVCILLVTLTDYLLFYVPLKNFSLIRRRHHYRWRAAKFRPMLSAQGLWAGKDLYRATPAVTQDLSFYGLIRSPLTTHYGMWRIYSNPDPRESSLIGKIDISNMTYILEIFPSVDCMLCMDHKGLSSGLLKI